jgi:hypothetical protein
MLTSPTCAKASLTTGELPAHRLRIIWSNAASHKGSHVLLRLIPNVHISHMFLPLAGDLHPERFCLCCYIFSDEAQERTSILQAPQETSQDRLLPITFHSISRTFLVSKALHGTVMSTPNMNTPLQCQELQVTSFAHLTSTLGWWPMPCWGFHMDIYDITIRRILPKDANFLHASAEDSSVMLHAKVRLKFLKQALNCVFRIHRLRLPKCKRRKEVHSCKQINKQTMSTFI